MKKQDGWSTPTPMPNCQEELAEGIASDDTPRGLEVKKILLGSGSKGVEELSKTLDASVIASNRDSGTVDFLKHDITGAGLKGKDAALDKWSRDIDKSTGKASGASIVDVASRQSTLEGLNDLELAGQSLERLQLGKISSTRANEIQANQQVWAALSEEKKIEIRKIGGATPSVDPTTSP